ncbi:Vmc-like lipoprotein signal peptide domain-containing protein [Lentzea albidocapillata]|uniref:Vmc-like lipoprotein signal peptide domain-containing protein n=1 Tax=Lentzea albidocapillata TaxID=40571 RepID=UPI003B845D32
MWALWPADGRALGSWASGPLVAVAVSCSPTHTTGKRPSSLCSVRRSTQYRPNLRQPG